MQVKNLHYIHHSQTRDWIDWTGDWRLKKVDQLHLGKSLYYIDPQYIQKYIICFKTNASIISITFKGKKGYQPSAGARRKDA